jgi:RND family efflux transporter MFP subunit
MNGMRLLRAPATLAVTAVGMSCRPVTPSVTVAFAAGRSIAQWEEFTGQFDATATVEIRPRISGYIERVAFHDGADVRAGDLLFVLDRRPYAAALAGAEADLSRARVAAAAARISAERAKTVHERTDAGTALIQARAQVRSARVAVEAARLNMTWTEIRSPIAGRVSRAEVTAGNLVQAGPSTASLLTSVVSLDPIYVYFDGDAQTSALTPFSAVGAPPRGQVFIGLANEDGYPHQGTIDFVDNRLASGTGTIRARAVLTNHHGAFIPGMVARVKLVASQPLTVTVVEDRAVRTSQGKTFVYVLEADSTIAYREVHIGRLVGGVRVVTAGLTPGELVVVSRTPRVRPGIKVRATIDSAPEDVPPDHSPSDESTGSHTALAAGTR